MSNANEDRAVSMYEILTALYPKGSLWRPKEFELTTTPSGNLVTNGDFATDDTTGWTVYDSTGIGETAGVSVVSEKARFFYSAT